MVFQHYVISNLDKYFPKSEEFLPERWLDENGIKHAFASLPFGYGRRMCIGRRFAELEMIILLSKVTHFREFIFAMREKKTSIKTIENRIQLNESRSIMIFYSIIETAERKPRCLEFSMRPSRFE